LQFFEQQRAGRKERKRRVEGIRQNKEEGEGGERENE
jgi:hypothetical protein